MRKEALQEIDFAKAKLSPELARFLGTFLRFEFALKERGFANGDRGWAEVDWDRFAKEVLGDEFYKQVRASGKTATILNKPPKKQIVRDGTLDFDREPPKPRDVVELLRAVRRVRNNVVHGGKSGHPDGERNMSLVREAQWIVEQALTVDQYLRYEFEGRY
jgi:hypothetical protein